MKSYKLIVSVIALGVMASASLLRAQDATPPAAGATPPPADQGGPGGPGGGKKGGKGGMMSPEQRLAAIDKAVTLTDDQKAKVKDILTKAQTDFQALAPEDKRTKGREIMQGADAAIRALLTADQQTKFDAMPKPGRGGKKKNAE